MVKYRTDGVVQSSACYKRMYARMTEPSADLSIIAKACHASSTGEVKDIYCLQ